MHTSRRRRLIQSWNDRASAYETDSGIAAPTDFSDSENAENALKEIKDEIEGDERRAHSDLSTAATDARSELAYGATPEAVQRLIDGGYFNWAYFNLGGDIEAIPIDLEGDDAAQELVDFSEDPENYDGDIAGIIAILNNIALASAERKKMTKKQAEAKK